ncbi:hypothetical protein C0V77_08895 [Emticicia sp. TH156]|nr:hypothetical protein C0V77_08895 [Emticicia sp. TH156]
MAAGPSGCWRAPPFPPLPPPAFPPAPLPPPKPPRPPKPPLLLKFLPSNTVVMPAFPLKYILEEYLSGNLYFTSVSDVPRCVSLVLLMVIS